MDISLSVLGRLNLDDQVDTRDVKTASSNVCGHQNAKLLLLKALQGDFSLVLGDVTMHHFDILFDLF